MLRKIVLIILSTSALAGSLTFCGMVVSDPPKIEGTKKQIDAQTMPMQSRMPLFYSYMETVEIRSDEGPDSRGGRRDAARKTPNYTERDLWLLPDEVKYKRDILAAVNMIAREHPDCMRIVPQTAARTPESDWAKPAFGVQCHDWYDRPIVIHFTLADVRARRVPELQKPIGAEPARAACEASLRRMYGDNVQFVVEKAWQFTSWPDGRAKIYAPINVFSDEKSVERMNFYCSFEGETIGENTRL